MLQQKNQNIIQRANERGVVAARRPVRSADQVVLRGISDILELEIRKAGHLKKLRRLGVTVVGFGRFDDDHRQFGPPTKDITEQVESSLSSVEVRLARIGIYGTDSRKKLGISIVSDELTIEKSEIESAFDHKGFPLLRGPYRKDGYMQHVSIGFLDINSPEYFKDTEIMENLETLTGLGPDSTLRILLEPVSAQSLLEARL